MDYRWPRRILLMLLWLASSWISTRAEAQELHRFGERVALGPDAALVVTRRDVGEFRSRYPSEFPSTSQNLVVFEVRSEGTGKATYTFWTDRGDPSRSDFVALCGTDTVNILKLGGRKHWDSNTYEFGRPGAFEIDGRWGAVVAFGTVTNLAVFDLPSGCKPEGTRLSVKIELGHSDRKAEHHLIFADR